MMTTHWKTLAVFVGGVAVGAVVMGVGGAPLSGAAAFGSQVLATVSAAFLRTDAASTTPVALASSGAGAASSQTRILLVPGHEPGNGGAKFGTLYERDLNVALADDLAQFLRSSPSYQVFVTRDDQNWMPALADYFDKDWNSIIAWVKASHQNVSALAASGGATAPTEIHNDVPTDVALRLYGITKWANENNIDLMVHIHFNDYPGRPKNLPGKYSGFVMYTPAAQYTNSSTTHAVAEAVFRRLSFYNPVSNLPVESSGFIDDPELIAVGANNTSDAASMLIEYEYLYQPQFVDPNVRPVALKDLAYQTYLGLEDYFSGHTAAAASDSYDGTLVYDWTNDHTGKHSDSRDIYALQTALILAGTYPPAGRNSHDCPHSGSFGACTEAALAAFQKAHAISGESNVAGPKTYALLHAMYAGTQ